MIVTEVAQSMQTAQKQPGLGMQQAIRGQGTTYPVASMNSSAPPVSGGDSSTPGMLGGRPHKQPIVRGKAPHHNLIWGRKYVLHDQTMAANLAREN